MKPQSARNKGSAAEREVLRILEDSLGLKLVRNKQQSARGGRDLEEDTERMQGLVPFAFEVKHQKAQSLNQWWAQTVRQAQDSKRLPVLFYRGNHQPWRVAVAPHDISNSIWPVRRDEDFVILSLRDGLQFLREKMNGA